MAKVKITYDYNNKTGKREIHIDYQSDPDALAYEHEKEHARIVGELVGRGILSADEASDVVFDRPGAEAHEKPEKEEEYIPERGTKKENV